METTELQLFDPTRWLFRAKAHGIAVGLSWLEYKMTPVNLHGRPDLVEALNNEPVSKWHEIAPELHIGGGVSVQDPAIKQMVEEFKELRMYLIEYLCCGPGYDFMAR